MGVSKKVLEKRREKAKELYEKGLDVYEIAEAIGVSISTVYNTLSIAGIELERSARRKEKLTYADNRKPVLEKVVIYGKWFYKNGTKYMINRLCTDLTPIFAPR